MRSSATSGGTMSSKKKQVRKAFRDAVFQRDCYTCQVCGKKWTEADADPTLKRINAHHITDRTKMPNGGYVKENGITVCDGEDSCHMRCEKYHISGGTEWEEGLHPDDLYEKIGSRYGLAVRKSRELK